MVKWCENETNPVVDLLFKCHRNQRRGRGAAVECVSGRREVLVRVWVCRPDPPAPRQVRVRTQSGVALPPRNCTFAAAPVWIPSADEPKQRLRETCSRNKTDCGGCEDRDVVAGDWRLARKKGVRLENGGMKMRNSGHRADLTSSDGASARPEVLEVAECEAVAGRDVGMEVQLPGLPPPPPPPPRSRQAAGR
ncbi:hypothetical protein E2C01_013208 [Portunus trituberculatus]|uniref:Uncharacterized protein n=1 Tax=Portunus trituberculatus TaxID=210409 RepID=A0A5B7DFL5_PORTR|nr:hypothetical protein [Portunus trituberculatus]